MDVLKTHTSKDFTFLLCFQKWFLVLLTIQDLSDHGKTQGGSWTVRSEWDSHKPPELQMLPYIRILLVPADMSWMHLPVKSNCLSANNDISPADVKDQAKSTDQRLLFNGYSFSHQLIQNLLGANPVLFLKILIFSLIKGLIADVCGQSHNFIFFASWGE